MKKNSLTIICWAIISCQLLAQSFIPTSLETYRAQWPVQVQKMLKVFETESTRPGQIQSRDSWNGDLQLDSTITFTIYEQGGGNTIAVPSYRTDHSYPLAATEVEIESVYEELEWRYFVKNTMRSDDLGRLISNMSEVWEPAYETWFPDSRIRAYPRGNSPILLDSFFVDGWSSTTNGWKRLLTVWNTYDLEDKQMESLSFLDLGDAQLLIRDVYSYDDNGNNTLIESFLIDGEEEIPAGLEELDYNNGLLVLSTSSVPDGLGGFVPATQVVYLYNDEQLRTIHTFEWDAEGNDWRATQSLYYQYDDEERVSSEETHLFYPEGVEERRRIEYEYVQDDYLAEESRFTFDFTTNAFLWEDRKFYYYKELVSTVKPSPVFVKALNIAPNPTTDEVRLSLEDRATVQIFNLNGQLLGTQSWGQGQETLNVANLPNGVYQIKAQTEEGLYLGKLVKQ